MAPVSQSLPNQIIALLILDPDANRLAVQYCTMGKKVFPTVDDQKKFEKKVIQKLPKPCGRVTECELVILDGILVLFKCSADIFFCLVCGLQENELIMSNLLESIYEAIANVTLNGMGVGSFANSFSGGLATQLAGNSLAAQVLGTAGNSSNGSMANGRSGGGGGNENGGSNGTSSNLNTSGVSKQSILENLDSVLLVLDEAQDDGLIMVANSMSDSDHGASAAEMIFQRIRMQDSVDNGEKQMTLEDSINPVFKQATAAAKNRLLNSLLGGRG